MDPLLAETATRILSDHRGAPDELWAALEDNGLTRVWVREADGGFDLEPAEGFGLLRLAGAHAAPVPLAETLMASWFLTEADLPVPSGKIGVLIDGWQRGVPFGQIVEHIVRVRGAEVSLHRGHLKDFTPGIGPDPLGDDTCLDPLPELTGEISGEGRAFAALCRASQICGGIEAVLEMSIAFAMQREQFGRPLSKFQAIQHMLSEIGAEAAAADAAVESAVMQVRRGKPVDGLAVAVAKYRTSVAAGIVSEHAHQVHGAIGYTDEYGLAAFTRRLWQWREDFGGDAIWACELGKAALSEAAPLWPRIADGTMA